MNVFRSPFKKQTGPQQGERASCGVECLLLTPAMSAEELRGLLQSQQEAMALLQARPHALVVAQLRLVPDLSVPAMSSSCPVSRSPVG